jgi:hypothetical protein
MFSFVVTLSRTWYKLDQECEPAGKNLDTELVQRSYKELGKRSSTTSCKHVRLLEVEVSKLELTS